MTAYFHQSSPLFNNLDTTSLHGVNDGPENHVLITNKSIISLYNVNHRKHAKCWNAKSWEPYTCAAIYQEQESRVICVTDSRILCLFNIEDEETKTYKFASEIFKVILIQDVAHIIFKSGIIQNLKDAIATRKVSRENIFTQDEIILDVQISEKFAYPVVHLFTKSKDETVRHYAINITNMSIISSAKPILKDDVELNTVLMTKTNILVTLWANGELHISTFNPSNGSFTPEKQLLSIQEIQTSKPARIINLSDDFIIIMGMDSNDEGSCLVLLDINFGIVNNRKNIKMYKAPPLCWVIKEGLIVVEAGSVALVNFTLNDSNINSMFSSRLAINCKKNQRLEIESESCCSWPLSIKDSKEVKQIPKEALQTIYTNTSSALAEVISSLKLGSLSQSFASSEVIKHLIQEKNTELLSEAIRNFDNIPEEMLVLSIKYFMEQEEDINASIMEVDSNEFKGPFSEKISKHLNLTISKPITPIQLLKQLHLFNFNNAVLLIRHLHYLLETKLSFIKNDIDIPTPEQVCVWLNLVLDKNYTQLIMTSEEDVEEVLLHTLASVTVQENYYEDISTILPVIGKMLYGTLNQVSQAAAPYSIERLIIS